MNPRPAPVLSAVLSPLDLPLAELCAARLDGELYRVDECFRPVDSPSGRAERGAALAAVAPARVIAELGSAAWVWGAVGEPPLPHRFCVDTMSRVHPGAAAGRILREVVVDRDDVVSFGGMPVTSVLRTCADLARFSLFTDADERTVRTLLDLGGRNPGEVVAYLGRRRNLPHKRKAIDRLCALATGRPRPPGAPPAPAAVPAP
ncbi:hypothetical protein [Planctomonas psychrotolerans]|uniref:hypothetical protein n=1 Tax=Planctomonas psychrotolerans TaxID=2528712 RepID=UPI0012393225|nr:hypothetical protein [Planctomonas psychrotolerans]